MLLLAACGAPTGGKLIRSSQARLTSPEVSAADAQQLAGDDAAFAFDFYRWRATQPGNLLFSPESASITFAMAYAGAEGKTADEIAQVLHFTLAPDALHRAFDALDLTLKAQGNGGEGAFQLHAINALWAQEGMSLRDAFLDTLAKDYGTGVRVLDFANDPSGARDDINGWVSDQTEGRIPELFGADAIDTSTRLVLADAIYFKADWAQPFDPIDTETRDFHLLDGTTVQVPTLSGPQEVGYFQGEGYFAASVPYAGDEVELLVIVPDEGQLSKVEGELSPSFLDAIVQNEQTAQYDLLLPKLSFTEDVPLKDGLVALGMKTPFQAGQADFSGIDGAKDLYLQAAVQKTFIAVDEKGTEAAAATGVSVGMASAFPGAPLAVDRPFIFALRDVPTGAILFLGRVVDPRR